MEILEIYIKTWINQINQKNFINKQLNQHNNIIIIKKKFNYMIGQVVQVVFNIGKESSLKPKNYIKKL